MESGRQGSRERKKERGGEERERGAASERKRGARSGQPQMTNALIRSKEYFRSDKYSREVEIASETVRTYLLAFLATYTGRAMRQPRASPSRGRAPLPSKGCGPSALRFY